MTVLSAQTIRRLKLISPFNERSVSNGRSFGLSGAGYDIRIAESRWVWPLWGRLASTIERFDVPKNVCFEVKDKSTNARRFITVQNTFGEPGWNGYLTLEITRHLPWPTFIRKGTPIAQIVFAFLDETTEQPYSGKYQAQEAGPQAARNEL